MQVIGHFDDDVRGVDIDAVITPGLAAAFFAHGYRFAIRYLPRTGVSAAPNLTAEEVTVILASGLGLTAVQHVESAESWIPSLAKGKQYGITAAEQMVAIGLPAGAMCWLDLEGVADWAPASITSGYCTTWYDAVHSAGFLPGIYVGWHSGLTPAQLYDLPFMRYWGAYNLNADQEPMVRGLCMKQHAATPADIPADVTVAFDVNTTMTDKLGGAISTVLS
jgi:hypothetical protein